MVVVVVVVVVVGNGVCVVVGAGVGAGVGTEPPWWKRINSLQCISFIHGQSECQRLVNAEVL